MQITLSPEDQSRLEDLISLGRYSSLEEAVHAAVDELVEDQNWKNYASDRIEAGWDDMRAGRTTPGEEVHAWLESMTQEQGPSPSNTLTQRAKT